MEIKSFKYYALSGLFVFLICSSGWVYLDYKDHQKWYRWLSMTESGEYEPISLKLTRIVEIESKTADLHSSGTTYRSHATIHHQAWLSDEKGKIYKQWIHDSRLSQAQLGKFYKLYKLGGVTIVPEFAGKRLPQYTVSSTGIGGVLIMFFALLIFNVVVHFGIKSHKRNLHRHD